MRTIPVQKLVIAFLSMTILVGGLFGFMYLRDRPPEVVQKAVTTVKAVSKIPPKFLYNLEMAKDDAMSGPLGVAAGADGKIYVADTGKDRILVFDSKGTFLKKFGKQGGADGEFRSPSSVAVSKDKLFVADLKNGAIKVFDLEGNFLEALKADVTYSPVAIAVAPDGRVYASDLSAHAILVWSPEHKFENRFGGAGDADGKLSYANGLTVDSQGNVWVADSNNARIQVFDRTGKVFRIIGKPPAEDATAPTVSGQSPAQSQSQTQSKSGVQVSKDAGPGMVLPRGIALDPTGRVTVVDALSHRVNVFDGEGKFLFGFGERGVENGQLLYPNGMAIDSASRVFITDRENARVAVFGY